MSNINQIKLGAPSSIRGGASPRAELSVQIAENIKEIDLKDNGESCTKYGAITTAGKLVRQLLNERNQEATEGAVIIFADAEALESWRNGTLWASQPSTLTGLVMKVDGEVVDAVFSIGEVIEGTTDITCDDEGIHVNGYSCFNLRARKWDDTSVMAELKIYVGCGYLANDVPTEWGNCVEGNILWLCKQNGDFDAWNDMIYSFVQLDKRNYITQVGAADAGYINTGIVLSKDTGVYMSANLSITGGTAYLLGGGGGTSANMMHLFINASSGKMRAEFRYSASISGLYVPELNGQWANYSCDIHKYNYGEHLFIREADVASLQEISTAPIYVFGAAKNNNGSPTRITNSNFISSIEYLTIRRNSEIHKFIPFIKNGENGMLDLYDGSFHGNAYTSGSFTITTEAR